MAKAVTTGLKVTLRAVVKAVTGFVIVPLSILIVEVMPNWRESSRPVQAASGLLIGPIYFFVKVAAPWWNDFDIID